MNGWWNSCVLVLLCIPSPNLSQRTKDEKCLGIEDVEAKHFYFSNTLQNITVLTSSMPGHRMVSEVFRIFGEEALGYSLHVIVNNNTNNSLDPVINFRNISSCTSPFCDDMDDRLHSTKIRVPSGMLTLGVLLPPSYHVDTWGLVDLGQLGPAPRFGWFAPQRTINSSREVVDHWRAFRSADKAAKFVPTTRQMQEIRLKTKHMDGSYICESSFCREGASENEICDAADSRCAVLLTDFPVHTPLFNTSQIAEQIRSSRLRVKIYFVGDNLPKLVDFLEKDISGDSGSYMLLVFHPSAITTRYRYTQIKFPACQDPLFIRDYSSNCMYSAKRMAKVIWKPVQNSAPEIFNFLESFSLSYYEYMDLIMEYNKEYLRTTGEVDVHKVACTWMTKNTSRVFRGEAVMEPWYNKWSSDIQAKTDIYIGGIFPNTGTKYVAPELAPVARLAVEHINRNDSILRRHKLQLNIQDGQCETDVVMKRFIDILKSKDQSRIRATVGILGPACSDTVEPIAGVSKQFRTVVISYSAEGSISKDNSKEYPYFFRTIAENKQYKYVYMEAMKRLDWHKVGALTEDGQKYSDYISDMQDDFQEKGIDFVINRKFPRGVTDMTMYLRDLKERGARIIIGDFYVSSARHVMCQAYKMKMTQREGYVWFLPGWFKERWFDIDLLRTLRKRLIEEEIATANVSSHMGDDSGRRFGTDRHFSWNEDIRVGQLPECSTTEMKIALNGHFSLVHSNFAPDDNKMQTKQTVGEWKTELLDYLKKTFNYPNHQSFKRPDSFMQGLEEHGRNFQLEEREVNKYSGYVYDAVWLYALALDKLIKENMSYIQDLHSERSVQQFVNIIGKIDFTGVSGQINFYDRQSRLSNIRIMQWYPVQVYNDEFNQSRTIYSHEVGEFMPNYSPFNQSTDPGSITSWNMTVIKWQTADGSKPEDDAKDCGILSSFATSLGIECTYAITVAFIISFIVVVILLSTALFIFKQRYERKMKAAEDRMRALGLLTPMSTFALDEWEIPRDRVVTNRKLGEGAFGTVYGGEAYFDEKEWVAVAVKTLKVGSSFEEKVDFLSEAEMMKRFDHKNVVKLLGVCTRNEPVYTVMEYMLYGDLKTYLLARRHLVNERNREEMDEVSNRRLTSMVHDVAKGLNYLADLKYVHRDLAARNCLVNSSRTVKLADFGMTRAMFDHDYYKFSRRGMLPVRWMSPESLVDGLFTPMSDIWSYGVLLYEAITFGSFPFQGLSNNQVLEHVKAGNILNIPAGIKPQLGSLLRSCWSRTPTKRPTAGEIVELLSNNPRLISPCIDVPLTCVQIERTDSLEMGPLMSNTRSSKREREDLSYSPMTGSLYSPLGGSAFSPMNGSHINGKQSPGGRPEVQPLMNTSEDQGMYDGGTGSYVPPGYIVLDHRTNTVEYSDFKPSSIASV